MRRPKDLILDQDQRAILNMNEIILVFDYRKISVKNANRLSKWLAKASLYLKNKKVKKKNPVGFIY